MRERLIEVFKKIRYNVFPGGGIDFDLATQFTEFALNDIVDKLLENGVIVLPCKVGDVVYVVKPYFSSIQEYQVRGYRLGEFPTLNGHKRKS